jgi:hypothetical protein
MPIRFLSRPKIGMIVMLTMTTLIPTQLACA